MVTTAQIRDDAKQAYIYGFPMVDNYRIQYAYFQDKQGSQFRSTWNTLHSDAHVATPADTAVQTPNSDTPYTTLGADPRAEPLVLTVPEVPSNRYYSVQLIDAYTYNMGYLGSRATGNKPGSTSSPVRTGRARSPPVSMRCCTQRPTSCWCCTARNCWAPTTSTT